MTSDILTYDTIFTVQKSDLHSTQTRLFQQEAFKCTTKSFKEGVKTYFWIMGLAKNCLEFGNSFLGICGLFPPSHRNPKSSKFIFWYLAILWGGLWDLDPLFIPFI